MKHIEKFGERWWGSLLMFLLLAFLPLFQVLFGYTVFSEHLSRFYPFFHFYKAAIIEGQNFLWLPGVFSGFPAVSTANGGFLSPFVFFALYFFSAIDVYNWLIFIFQGLAGFLSYFFLRRIGVSFWPSFLGGVVYMFSEWRWVSDVAIASIYPVLPVLFLIFWEVHNLKKFWLGIIAGIILGHAFLVAIFHYILETIFAFSIFVFYLLFRDRESGQLGLANAKKNISVVIAGIITLVIASAIALVQVAPTLVLAPHTTRLAVDHWGSVRSGIDFVDFFKLFLPYFDSPLFSTSYDQFYIGLIPFLLLVVGLSRVRKWRREVGKTSCVEEDRVGGLSAEVSAKVEKTLDVEKKKNSILNFFVILFVIGVLLSLNNSWFFWALHHLPPFNLIHHSFRWMFVSWFAAAVIVGIVAEKIFFRNEPFFSQRVVKIFDGVLIFIVTSAIFFKFFIIFFSERILQYFFRYFDQNLYAKTSGLPLEHYHSYIESVYRHTVSVFDLTNPKFFVPFIFILVSWYLVRAFCRGRISGVFAARWATLLVAVNFVAVFFLLDNTFSRKILSDGPSTARFLNSYPVKGRTMPFLKNFTEFQKINIPAKGRVVEQDITAKYNLEILFPNTNILYGLDSADMYDPMTARRAARPLGYLGSSLVWQGEQLETEDVLPEEKARRLAERKNVLNFLGIRFIISSYELDSRKFNKIFSEKVLSPYDIDLAIYENESVRPLFYFADSVGVIPEDELAAFEKLKTIPEEGLGVFVECDFSNIGCSREHPMLLKNFDGKGEIEIKTKKNTISILKTQSETPQFLVFSENHLPGWKAYVDGSEIPIYTVGSVYMGVVVSEGEHEIKFEFTYKTIIKEFLKKYLPKFLFLNSEFL